MKIFTVNDWSGIAAAVQSDPAPSGCGWYGIAIGPESDEGRIRVNGIMLQAGRVLPLRAASYELARVTTADASIARLQVMLFESPAEIGVEVARPNGEFSELGFVATAASELVLTVPFVGRRQCRIVLAPTTEDDLTAYSVIGYAHAPDGTPHSETLATNAAPDAGTNAFYVGGTDNGECWDYLEIYATQPLTGLLNVLATTIGEIGAR